jgi:CcmD family protein
MQAKDGTVHEDPGLGPAVRAPVGARNPAPATAGERATEFAPVQSAQESTGATTLLVVAYLVMWALLFGFVLMGWRRQRAIDVRLSELEKSLPKAGA